MKNNSQIGNKILIIGCAGSGKTTLTKKIKELLNLPVIHMDRFYWRKNWQKINDADWENKVKELAQTPNWIMDGNYTTTLSIRLNYASSVIYLDVPRWKCLARVILRRFRWFNNLKRQDMPEGCKEHINWKFYQWVWSYPKRSRQKTFDLLKDFNGPVYVLKTNKDIGKFISNLLN